MSDDLQPMLLNVCAPCRAGRDRRFCQTTGCAFVGWLPGTAATVPMPARSREEMVKAGSVALQDCWESGTWPDSRTHAAAVLIAAGVLPGEPSA